MGNRLLLWAGPRCTLSYSLARPARRVAGHRVSSSIPQMAFDFSGIFATAGGDVLAAFRSQFGGVGQLIHSPFSGFGVTGVGVAISLFPDDPEVGPDAANEALAAALLTFSNGYPQATFVYVYAECFGGTCEYAGFAFRAGVRVHDEPFRDHAGDDGPLRRLVSHLDVRLGGSAPFEPLRRGYFARVEQPPSPPAERVRDLGAQKGTAVDEPA